MLADEEGGGLEQGAGDVLAAAADVALPQRGEDRDHAEHAAGDVDDGRAGAHGAAGQAGHVGQAAHHLRDFVESDPLGVGAVQETLEAAIDETGVTRREFGIAEAEPVHGAGTEVLQHHIGVVQDVVDEFPSAGVLEVGAEAALVAVVHREIATAGCLEAAGVVATGRLDLQYIGTEIGKDQARGGTHHHVRELDHAQVLKG